MPAIHPTPERAAAWEIWRKSAEGSCERLAGQAADAADLLKILLAEASAWLERRPDALLALRPTGEDGESAAALLEGLAAMEFDGLIMDERTASLLPPPYRAERIGFLPGLLAEPFCAHRLEVSKPVVEVVKAPARAGAWDEALSRVTLAGGRFLKLQVVGATGSGKSHFVSALAAWLTARGFRVARAACLPTDVPGAFTVWKSLLKRLGDGDPAAMAAAVGRELALDESLVDQMYRFLRMSETSHESEGGSLSPMQHKDTLPEFIARMVWRMVGGGACALVIDDFQWMDDGGLRVAEALGRGEGEMVLLLGRRGWPEEGDIGLGPMSREEHRQLIADWSGHAVVTDALNDEIHRISGGLPLVSREVHSLMSRRRQLMVMGETLDLAPDGWLADVTRKSPLTERFLDLSPRLRALLGSCAIWREPFTQGQAAITAAACSPGIDFEACWMSPLLGEYIGEAQGLPGRFLFFHDLLREAALSLLTEGDRAAGHGAALDWMRGRPPGLVSSAEAALHARGSGRNEEAMEWYEKAAHAALGRFALREAREAARAALGIDSSSWDDPAAVARRARLHQVEGEAAFHWGMVEEAAQSLEKSLVLYGVSPREGEFPIRPGMLLRHLWLLAGGRPMGAKSGMVVPEGAAKAALTLAEIAYFQNDQKRSADCCLTALDLAVKSGESAMLASLCAAIACPMSGRRPRWLADRYRMIARKMIARVGDESEKIYIEHVGCLVDLDKARWDEAAKRATGNIGYWKSHGQGRRMEEAATHAFLVDYFRGDLVRAAKWAELLRESSIRRTDRQSRTWAAMMGSLHALACVGAREAEAHCREVPVAGGDAITQSSIHVMRALCAWRSGNPWQAMGCLSEAEALAGGYRAVSSTQFLLAEAAVLLGEMRRWGPQELAADDRFVGLSSRFMKRAESFAKSFSIGRVILHCARGLHGVGGRGEFAAAERAAIESGARFFHARVRCHRALASSGEVELEDGVNLLKECGAGAEAAFFAGLYPSS